MKLRASLVQTFRVLSAIILATLTVSTPIGVSVPWWVLTVLGALILVSELLSTVLQGANSSKMQKIQRRALRVIADLSSGTGARHDIWVVEIYLPRLSWPNFRGIRKLKRTLSLSLTDIQEVPAEIALSDDGPLARCYKQRKRLLWADTRFNTIPLPAPPLPEDDKELRNIYGAVSINPLVDDTGHKCRGILLVHTKPDPEFVTTAVGILGASRGRRHIVDASHDIHGHLA